MTHLDVDGSRLELRHIIAPPDTTARAPIVFLHEGLGSVSLWRDWPDQVCAATGRAGVVYSRRGYGQSDPVPDVRGPSRIKGGRRVGRLEPDYMHHEAWVVLPDLLRQLGLPQPPVLLGHSDGATIALLHASRHPVSACIAMAPHVIVEDVSVASIAQAREAWQRGELRPRLARHHADVDGAFWQWNDIWLDPRFRAFDIREDCRSIAAPVLALQGLDDVYGSLRQILDIGPAQAPVWRRTLAHCGHSPHRDQGEATMAAVRTFLSAQP